MNMDVSIGAMRARLTLEAPSDPVDDAGAIQRTWIARGDVWAHLTPRKAAGEFVADAEGAAITWDVTMRWRSDVLAPMRLRCGTRILAIQAAFDPDSRRRILVCRCVETSA